MNRILPLLTICTSFLVLPSPTAQITKDEVLRYLETAAMAPDDYILKTFDQHDIILLGERHLVRENLLFVQGIIPKLHAAGVYTIGMEFGATEMQGKLDSLVTAETYDEALAMEMMFAYNVTWGYREYIDVYRAAWQFNRTRPPGTRPFRILNLSYVYDWPAFTGERNRASMQRVFPKGTVDKFRAEVIEREIMAKGEKILALVGTPHAFTRYGSPYYKYNGDDFCAFDHDWLGNRLYRKYPGKTFSILLHQAFVRQSGNTYAPVSPADGAIERLMQARGNAPAGFDLLGSPAGDLPDHSDYATCYPGFTLGAFFDGYIFLVPLRQLEGCTVLPDFVHNGNAEYALRHFPDPDWHGEVKTLADLKAFIAQNAKAIAEEYKGL